MLHAFECVEAFANELPTAVDNHRTNAGAGRGESAAAAREIHCLAHECSSCSENAMIYMMADCMN